MLTLPVGTCVNLCSSTGCLTLVIVLEGEKWYSTPVTKSVYVGSRCIMLGGVSKFY